jgi:hypothetical protein
MHPSTLTPSHSAITRGHHLGTRRRYDRVVEVRVLDGGCGTSGFGALLGKT